MSSKKRSFRGLRFLMLVVLLSLVAAACTSDAEEEPGTTAGDGETTETTAAEETDTTAPEGDETTQPEADDVVVGIRSPITTLDPYNSPDEVNGGTVNKLIYQNLVWVELDETGTLQYEPLLATDWERVSPTTWELELREGVVFHDGTTFDAEDVEFTFNRYKNENARTGNIWAMGWFDSIEVVDPQTVRINTTYELANLHAWVAYAPKIISKDSVENAGQTDAEELSGEALVGTGPYVIDEFVRDESLSLTLFDSYWGDPPEFSAIEFIPVQDDSARIAALQTGEVDLITAVPPALTDQVEGSEGVDLISGPSARYTYVWLNTLQPPMDDPVVRQAINMAVDMDAITESIFAGAATPADAPLAPANFGYVPQDRLAFDPEGARQLLEDAGYELPVEIDFWTPQARYLQDREVATAIQGFLNQAGFSVNLNVQEWGSLSSEIFTQQEQYRSGEIPFPEYDMLLISWASITLDGDYALFEVFHCDEAYNLSYYCNEDVDALLREARVSTDQAQRQQLYRDAIEIIWNEYPQLFGWYEPQILAKNESLQNVKILPFEHYLLHEASWAGPS